MKNYARLHKFIADFTLRIETCGGAEPIPVTSNFWDRAADVRATPQKTA